MHSLPQISFISSRQAFEDSMTSTNAISSTTADNASVRSAAEQISRLLLIFVPTSSRQVNSIEDDPSRGGSRNPSVLLSTYFNFAFYFCCSPIRFIMGADGQYLVHKFIPQQVCDLFK